MSSDSYRPAVTRFVEAATDIANRLDFTVEMPCRQFVLAGRLRQLDRLWMDLTASTAAVGRDGVAVARAAEAVGDALAAAVEAHDADDFRPWHRGQDTVREQLDVLRRLADANRRAQHVSVKIAPAASPTAAPVAAVSEQTNSQKNERGGKDPRRRRRGTGNPNGRPSKEADKSLRKVIQQISAEARREGLDVGQELHTRVYQQSADGLCELIRDRLRDEIAPSTLRSSSKLWKTWGKIRNARGQPNNISGGKFRKTAGRRSSLSGTDLPVETGSLRVGGVKRTADEREQDAELLKHGITIDDD